MIKTRLLLPVFAAIAAIAVAGCGSGGSSSSADPASFAAPGSLVFVEGKVKPSGTLKSDVDSVASTIAGIDNLGDFVVSELESSARDDGEPFNYAKEIEPWLGEKAGVAFKGLEDGDLTDPLIAVQTTDADATQEFIDNQAEESKEPFKDGSYEGVEFKVGGSEVNAIGVIDEALVIAEGETAFKAAVDASDGDSLAGEARFTDAISAASDGSLADVYVDVGGLIEQSGDEIDPQAQEVLENAGIDPSEATAVASVVPGSERIEIELSSDLGGQEAPTGDASKLLSSMPSFSFAAVAVSDFGSQLQKAIDELDKSGIPGELPPNQLKSTLSQAGIDLDKIIASIDGAAIVAEGSSESELAGALVLATNDSGEATNTVSSIGTLLRNAAVPGVSAVHGAASGFSIHNQDLGRRPVVVLAEGNRIAVGYGLSAALRALHSGSGNELRDEPSYQAAKAALGETPISAFVDGPASLELAEALVPHSETEFWDAQPYLKKISYVALGSGTDDDLATAKVIVGLEK